MMGDLRIAFRKLWKSPGFTVTAIVTLALGIGANAVVFSVLNAVVLRPVKLPNAQNLYEVQRFQYPSHSYPDYVDMRDRNRTFESMVMAQIMGPVGVDSGGSPSTAWPYLASGNYFDALGIQPYLGRFYHANDEKGTGQRSVCGAELRVLARPFSWRCQHGWADGAGEQAPVHDHWCSAAGVSRYGAVLCAGNVDSDGGAAHDWGLRRTEGTRQSQRVRGGKAETGSDSVQATQDLNTVGTWLSKTYPGEDDGVKFTLARPGLIGDMLGGPARAFMSGLMLLAGLILLAACANLGSLFAARAADRAKETALRLALGSRRGMILRQMLTEAVLVSLGGGAVGLAGGVVILRFLSTWQPIPDTPINVPVNPDAGTYIVALVLALASGLLFGMVPVRQVLHADPWQVIRTGAAGVGGLRRFTLRDVLLAVQIAICAVLVTSSLVAVRGLARSMHSNFGFVPQNVMLAGTELHMSGYTDDRELLMQRRMLEVAKGIPGATAAGYVDHLPLGLEGGDSFVYNDSTTDYRPTNVAADAMNFHVSPGYMQAAGTTLLAGRDLTMQDDAKAPKVALVNRQFAVKVFGSVNKAVGGHFKYYNGTRAEVVGVVEDGKYRTLTEDQQPAMFFSFLQERSSNTWLLVRSNRDPQEISAALEKGLHGLDSAMPIVVRPWSQAMGSALFAARVASVALGVLGLLGAMLAVTGIFGMASYTVSKRLRELGIRMALGGGRKEVLRAALGRAFVLLSVGSVAGLALGLLATKVLSFIVYQASPNDPVVLGGVIFTMLLLGMVAAWVPAQKALAVNPVMLMREE